MLADQAAHVGAVRSRFASEARRVGRVLQRQLTPVENLFAMEIRQRHFGRRNQEQIPVARDPEQILFELRQVARARQRRAIHHERRLDFAVAVLARVQIEHEIDQRAREPGAATEQHGKPCAGHARGAFEIKDPECRAQLPVRLRLEVHHRRRAPAPDFGIVRSRLPHRHGLVRKVRQREQRARRAAAPPRPAPFPARGCGRPWPCSPQRSRWDRALRASPAPPAPRRRSVPASGFRRAESTGGARPPGRSALQDRQTDPGRVSAAALPRPQDVPSPAVDRSSYLSFVAGAGSRAGLSAGFVSVALARVSAAGVRLLGRRGLVALFRRG